VAVRQAAAGVSDAAIMEASLAALGDRYQGLAAALFDRFIAAHPHYAFAFANPGAARERMTRETLEALLGLGGGEWWVATTIANFVDLHHTSAAFTARDYAAWFELAITEMERRAGADWPPEAADAWRRQAARLAAFVADELARHAARAVSR
jgi:hypothetical protein